MCMPLEFLILFLNLIGPETVTSEPGRFVVHATEGDVTWVETEDVWCTMAPQIDRMARF